MGQIVKGLVPGASYKLHPLKQVQPWLHYFEPIPFTAISTTVADANGTVDVALPVDINGIDMTNAPYVLVGPDNRGRVLQADKSWLVSA